jgi:hypothetical protein
MKKITKINLDLEKNGFVLLKKFFCKCPDYKNFKKNLFFFLSNAVKSKKIRNYDKIIIDNSLKKKNNCEIYNMLLSLL